MTQLNRAQYGAAAYANLDVSTLPGPFPRTMGPNAMKYLQEVVDSGLQSDMVERCEAALAKAIGVKHCIATPGCTPAMAVLAAALRFAPGDEVIISPITDYGTLMGFVKEGLIPVFADSEPDSTLISPASIEQCITPRTRAIVCVHKTGAICDMDAINAIAARHNIIVIEDVCQAVLGTYKGRTAGTLAHAAGFSFDSEKTMGSDMGGCLVTNDDKLAEYARYVGHSRGAEQVPGFGRTHSVAGYAHRMPLCTAAVTLAQLEIASVNVTQRDAMARYLTQLLAEIPGITPHPIPTYQGVYSCWMMGFTIDPARFTINSDEFARQCHVEGLARASTARYYLMPAALTFLQKSAREKAYPFHRPYTQREYSYSAETCPNAKQYLENFIRWLGFCEKYTHEHCRLAAKFVHTVAERNRK